MIPTGDFDRLSVDVIKRYTYIDIPITFGVLIADYRQTLAREYILNYVKVFDKKSNKYIDFFIPGYAPFYGGQQTKLMDKDHNQYYFNEDLFLEFIDKFERVFDISYEFNPMLVLVELNGNRFESSRKMVLALDSMDGGVKKSGVLFQKIFDIARSYVSLDDFSNRLISTYIKGNVIDSIINALGNDFIAEVNTQQKNIRRFLIK